MIIVFPLQLFSQQLADVVQSAIEYNNQTKAAKLQTQSAENEMLSEQRSHLPSISLKASYVHITDVPQFEIPIPGFNRTISLNPQDSYETGVQVDYIVFSGFAQSQATKVKEFEHKISRVNERQKNKDVVFNVIQAYRNAQFMKLSLDILADTRQRNVVQMQQAKALLKNGMALRLDTLSLSLNRLSIEQQIIKSKTVLENWLQLLKTLTGKHVNIAVTAEMNNNPVFNAYSVEDQSSVKNIKLQQQKISAIKGISSAAYYPKIWLSASFNYGKPGIDIIKNDWSTYGKWMIGLQWNIWNWRSDAASIEAKHLQYQALQFSERALSDQAQLNYDKALRSFKTLEKQHMVAREAVKVAREKMQIVEANAQNGQLSASDFNEANLELSQAELKQKQILVQLNLQASEIDYLSGKPVNSWRF